MTLNYEIIFLTNSKFTILKKPIKTKISAFLTIKFIDNNIDNNKIIDNKISMM